MFKFQFIFHVVFSLISENYYYQVIEKVIDENKAKTRIDLLVLELRSIVSRGT